jgi:hypothetical protein
MSTIQMTSNTLFNLRAQTEIEIQNVTIDEASHKNPLSFIMMVNK